MRLQLPYAPSWARALALLASPPALPRTLQLYGELADAAWHAAGDEALDASWYAKRAALAGVYTATELYSLTDASPGARACASTSRAGCLLFTARALMLIDACRHG